MKRAGRKPRAEHVCPGVSAEFAVHQQVIARGRGIAMIAGSQPGPLPGEPPDNDRDGETDPSTRRQQPAAFLQGQYRVFDMFKRV